MSKGWIKLHRVTTGWEWYTDHNTCRLFIHCLLRANHTDTKWRGQEIKRGQFITSIETLQKETGLSTSQIRTSIKKLISTNEIASLSQARSRVITIVEYDTYQGDDRLSDKLVTSSSQADDKVVTTDKNDNKDNKDKNDNKTPRSPSGDDLFGGQIGDKKTNCPHEEIKSAYNRILPELSQVYIMSDARKKNLRSLWLMDESHQRLEFWTGLFTHIRNSEFLMGRSSDWKCSFDFILNQKNFIKIYEGNYD